ncbi:MAG: class I SAM-dependent methyltransferase [Deltaproteobacteria bacterium]|nr:class I SAM-dependent methyltransferase [Deltaproteobacteria bacterium]
MFGYQLYYSTINPQPKQNRFFYKIFGVMHVGERIRFTHVSRLVKQKIDSPMEILDAGSGNGNYAFYLRKVFPKAKITAVDICKEKIHNASYIVNSLDVKNISFNQKSLTNMREKLKYDLAICIDVLEHIKDDLRALRRVKDSLKPGGSLILHVPKDRKLVFRHFKRFKGFRIEDHVREEYRIEEIYHKLEKVGLKVDNLSYTQGWFGSLAWEIDLLLIGYLRKLRYIAFPFLYMLILADVYGKNRNGNGFLFHCLRE